jgi:hypothetical protein
LYGFRLDVKRTTGDDVFMAYPRTIALRHTVDGMLEIGAVDLYGRFCTSPRFVRK